MYYANHDQALTQWTHPRTGQRKIVSEKLPFGWERKILPDHKVSRISSPVHNALLHFLAQGEDLCYSTRLLSSHPQKYSKEFSNLTFTLTLNWSIFML